MFASILSIYKDFKQVLIFPATISHFYVLEVDFSLEFNFLTLKDTVTTYPLLLKSEDNKM